MPRQHDITVRGVHHIGILVRDAAAAAERFRATMGLSVARWEDYGPGLLRIGFIPLGATLIELIEPLTGDGFNAAWLRERGEGIQHIAFQVDDIRATIAALKARGVPLRDDSPRPGAGGTLIAFLAADATGGLLLELTQPDGDAGATSPPPGTR